MTYFYIVVGVVSLLMLYLWHVERGMSGTPPEASKLPSRSWTPEDVRMGYEKTKSSPTNVTKHLPPKLGRRYIVVGGAGLVGGSIVQHLLLRGEDPEALRILDLREPTQSLIVEKKVRFIKTDVASVEFVNNAFAAAWPSSRIAKLPLTIFHTVAYINPSDRKQDFMAIYQAVNIDGTRHVLQAAKSVGATCLIATASGSIGMKLPSYFISPFTRWAKNILQILSRPESFNADLPISAYNSCYAYSKAVAESYVLKADSPTLRTGCVRPGHAIYGAGVSNTSSVSWSYLSRGGSPTWLYGMVTNFVNAQNVSIAHLAFEASILSDKDVSGRTYYVTDPGRPVYYGDLYTVLNTMAHKDTPANFPKIPAVPILLIGYAIEAYMLIRARYLPGIPPITGDISIMTPAMFNMASIHVVYDNQLATEEIGYQPPISTMEGLCLQLLEWNDKVEQGEFGNGGRIPREPKIQALEEIVNVTVPVLLEVNKM